MRSTSYPQGCLVEEPDSSQAMTGSDSEGCKVRGGGSCLTSRAGNGASGLPGLKQVPQTKEGQGRGRSDKLRARVVRSWNG